MKTIGVYEAKTQFSKLIDLVARGERVIVTRHGEPVAELRPVERERPTADEIAAGFVAFRASLNLARPLLREGESFRDLAHEGHEY